jgi:hypothetical protein
MPEIEIPDAKTPATPRDMFEALADAATIYHVENPTDPPPPRDGLMVLLAQWGLETGVGSSMHCFNVGNAKHVPGDGHDFCYFACDEIIDGKVVWFYPKDPGCCFRAFSSLGDGARDYYSMIRGNFAHAWPAVMSGDTDAFARLLKEVDYYTADEGRYAASLGLLFHEFESSMKIAPVGLDLHTVTGLQHALNLLRYGPLAEDGSKGSLTDGALRRFQRDTGLPADAQAPSGSDTFMALVHALEHAGKWDR